MGRTRQGAVEGLLSSVAPHVRTQCICAGVRLAFAGAVGPLARVPFLSAPDVVVVDMLHQSIHVPQITCAASIPAAHSNLVITLTIVIIILVVTQHTQEAG